MTRAAILAGALAAVAVPAHAHADRYTEVTSAFDPGDRFDLTLSLDYGFTSRSSSIKRELAGLPGTDPDAPMPIVKDLVFSSSRHEIAPRLELGIFTDLWLSAALPIVIRDSRHLSYDQRADPCVFPGDGGDPTCINGDNSTTVADGILPATGFDADDPTGPGFTDPSDPLLFRGPTRSGLDQLHLGIGWAPMNQQRDDTKPTWKIGAELRLAVGSEMHFDREAPGDSTGVGRGVHDFYAWTSIAKRVSWAAPHFETWWIAPFATTDDSPLRDPDRSFGATSISPQQRAGTRFGFEAIVWERPSERQRVSLDAAAAFEAHFEGRAMTDMWEVFQYAGDARLGGPLVLDGDPPASGVQPLSHPGATNVENYLTFTGSLGVDAELGDRVTFGADVAYFAEQSHMITFADAGTDLPTCTGGQSSGCETDDNLVVDPESREASPLHVQLIDVAGHRYRVDEGRSWTFSMYAKILF